MKKSKFNKISGASKKQGGEKPTYHLASIQRRAFLKTVGGAAGAAALGGAPKFLGNTASAQEKPGRGETTTYGLAEITSADSESPFTLPVRQPGWFPDGADIGGSRNRLFLEEVAGETQTGLVETLPVEFDYTGTSKKWILGSRISDSKDSLTRFVRRLAVKIRQYNASLYRLRRLHFYWDYKDRDPRLVKFPKANPHGDPKTTPDPVNDLPGFGRMVSDAEADWAKVTDQVNDLLETASSPGNSFGITLLAADMAAANGYIVSMRVVARDLGTDAEPGVPRPPEIPGSSSHVSISSPFSSSSP